jgi:hypothetical protein
LKRVVAGQRGTYTLGDALPYWTGRSTFYELDAERVYKEFPAPRADARERACLARLVEVGGIQPEKMHPFLRRVTWPLDLVEGPEGITGVVLPRVDASYFDTAAGLDTGPRPLANLMGQGVASVAERLLVVADLAGALHGLEQVGLMHGDISENNATWRLAPEPGLLMLDCDGLRSSSDPPRGEATPNWRDPRLDAGKIAAHDPESDRWALALVVWRVLVEELNARAPAPSAQYEGDWPPLLVPLFRETFDDPQSDHRPSPDRWHRALRDTARDPVACEQFDLLLEDLRAGRPPRGSLRRQRSSPSRPSRIVRGKGRRRGRRASAVAATIVLAIAILLSGLYDILGGHDRGGTSSITVLPAALAARVPGELRKCHVQVTDMPSGVQALVRCPARRDHVTYHLFQDRKEMRRWFDGRAERHRALRHPPGDCSDSSGSWHDSHGTTRGRYVLSGRRMTWTDWRNRLGAVLSGPAPTARVCAIWKDLPA